MFPYNSYMFFLIIFVLGQIFYKFAKKYPCFWFFF